MELYTIIDYTKYLNTQYFKTFEMYSVIFIQNHFQTKCDNLDVYINLLIGRKLILKNVKRWYE